MADKKITVSKAQTRLLFHDEAQGELFSVAERDIEGIGMGVLSDGTPYLNQRGLAALCGVQNAHIGTISSQWRDDDVKPRINTIKTIIEKAGFNIPLNAHIEIMHNRRINYCYPAEVCLAVLEYYSFDAGSNCQDDARNNYRKLAGSRLKEFIYQQVGYDPKGKNVDRFKKWHERIELNYQSAPRGFFHVFNEAHTIIYELILAGANVDERMVVDISIGQHWSTHWCKNSLAEHFGERQKYPHRYPPDHPQALSNPQESWCYPLSALGVFREWLQDDYLEGGKFRKYISNKIKRGELPPSIAELAIGVASPPLIEG